MKRHNSEKYCLVLSGGGSKGIYHLGAWKALDEMGIRVEAFIGNSIGAILAGFLAQGKTREMQDIGDNLSADFIMKIPAQFIENGELKIGKANLSAFRDFYHSVIEKKGIDVSPLRNMVHSTLSEQAIRESGHDLGVVTFNLSDFKPRYVFLDEMEEGTVLDYLMASAAFPGLEQTVIGGKSFIDGGIVDNMPYKMALARGYRNIIVVDISGMGVNRKPDIMGTKTVYIKNSVNMGWVFDFSRPFLHRFRMLGYLDTKKAFGRLKGERYFIRPDHRSERVFRRYIKSPKAGRILNYYLPGEDHALPPEMKIRRLLPESMRQNRELLYCLADCAASSFQLDRFREYSLPELARAVKEKKIEEDGKIRSLQEGMTPSRMTNLARNLEVLYKGVRERDSELDSPYYDYLLCTEVLEWGQRLLVRGLMHYYKELPAGLLTADFLSDFR